MPASGARPTGRIACGCRADRAVRAVGLEGVVGAASHRQECGADPRSGLSRSAPLALGLSNERAGAPAGAATCSPRVSSSRCATVEQALRMTRILVAAALSTSAAAAHAHPDHPRVAFDVERWRAASKAPVFGLLFLDAADPGAVAALAAWRAPVSARRIELLPVVMLGPGARPLDVGAIGSTRAVALDVLDVPGRFGARRSGEVLAWTRAGARVLDALTPETRPRAALARLSDRPNPAVSRRTTVDGVAWVALDARADVALTRTELTAGVFAACIHAGACDVREALQGAGCPLGVTGKQGLPMTCVSARGADSLCAWLGARLPTVEELRDAATWGLARATPWGHTPPSCDTVVMDGAADPYGTEAGCLRRAPWPPCSRPAGASREGLCDLLGNVAEWTADVGPAPGLRRVFGGDFTSRTPSAIEPPPSEPEDRRSVRLGVRCAREP
jgi:hypothetical protein